MRSRFLNEEESKSEESSDDRDTLLAIKQENHKMASDANGNSEGERDESKTPVQQRGNDNDNILFL